MKLKFELNETQDGLVVTGGEYLEGELVIPSEQEYEDKMYPVTEIGMGAFFNCTSLTNIVIPDSVTEIGEEAFIWCESLKSIVIPNSVTTIGKSTFRGCKDLTSIVIPKMVTKIEDWAFADCESLKNIVIPTSVKKIGVFVFRGCNDLSSIVVAEDNLVYDSREGCNAIIETSTNKLVSGCSDTMIPSSVTKIEEGAFSFCKNLNSIVIHASINKIGEQAFYGCENIKRIVVDAGNKVYDSREDCNAIIETSSNRLVQGCASTIIPTSVTEIDNYAFSCCKTLKSIYIPASIITIGYDTFDRCENLKRIVVDAGNKVYDSREDCNAIIETSNNILVQGCATTIIPASVTEIDWGAFNGCTGLTNIVIPDSVTEIGKRAFYGCESLEKIVISDASLLENAGVPKGVKIVKPRKP